MKNLSLVFSSLALIGVFVLLGMKLNEKKTPNKPTFTIKDSSGKEILLGGKVGFVDIDTLESNYNYFKLKKAEFEVRQKNIDAELEKMASSLQSEYNTLQKQAQAGTLSQSDGEAAQQRLMQRQQELELKRQSMGAKFLKDQEAFNKEIHDNLHEYIEKYNVEWGYDYILSYSKDGSILYANKDLDLTQDIIKGMNSENKKPKKENVSDDEASK
jgi:outer membrane protein